jgi:hypothetical protein
MRRGRDRAPSGECVKCGTWRQSLHTDHIVPKWQGGADTPDNYQYLCANCHEDKTWAERASEEYRQFVSAQVTARMLSQDARQRISEAVKAANKRRVWTPEMRQRCSRKGVKRAPFTAEHKANISVGRRAMLARKSTWPILVN